MASGSSFIFNNNKFAIASASIEATLPDPYWCDTYNDGRDKDLSWSISFEAVRRKVNGDYLKPSLCLDGLTFRLDNWHELSDQSVAWTKPVNPDTGEEYGSTYFREHLSVVTGKVEIRSRRKNRFRMFASGTDEKRHSFEIEASVPFEGVRADGTENDTPKLIKERLSEWLDPSNLSASRLQRDGSAYNSGVAMASMLFKPKL